MKRISHQKSVIWYRFGQGKSTAQYDVPKPRPLTEPATAKWLTQVGLKVREQRKKAGFTQQRLAEDADLAVRNVQKIEHGEFSCLISTMRKIRMALGCRYDDLMPD